MAPKTKKNPLLKVMPCHHWGKYRIKNTTFTLESAHKLLNEFHAKKNHNSTKSKFKIYQSGVKIKRSGHIFVDKILFENIVRFFVFKTEPHMLFIGVEKGKKRFYHAILFRDLCDVNEVCDLIEKNKNPNHVAICPQPEPPAVCYKERPPIEEEEQLPVTPICVPYEEKEAPPKVIHCQEIGISTDDDYDREREVMIICEQSKPVESKPPPIIKTKVNIDYDGFHTDDLGTTKIDALLLRTNNNSTWYSEDMKYLEYNPQLGITTETSAGPIYMYTAHFTAAEYNTIGSCESDSDSSWSGQSASGHSRSSSEHQGMITKKYDGRTVVMAHRGSTAGFE